MLRMDATPNNSVPDCKESTSGANRVPVLMPFPSFLWALLRCRVRGTEDRSPRPKAACQMPRKLSMRRCSTPYASWSYPSAHSSASCSSSSVWSSRTDEWGSPIEQLASTAGLPIGSDQGASRSTTANEPGPSEHTRRGAHRSSPRRGPSTAAPLGAHGAAKAGRVLGQGESLECVLARRLSERAFEEPRRAETLHVRRRGAHWS